MVIHFGLPTSRDVLLIVSAGHWVTLRFMVSIVSSRFLNMRRVLHLIHPRLPGPLDIVVFRIFVRRLEMRCGRLVVREAAHFVVVVFERCIGLVCRRLTKALSKRYCCSIYILSQCVKSGTLTPAGDQVLCSLYHNGKNAIVVLLSLSTILFSFVFHLLMVAMIVLKPHLAILDRDECVHYHVGFSPAYWIFVFLDVGVISCLSKC